MNARYQTDWVAPACGPLSVRMAQEPAEVQLPRDALNCGHALKVVEAARRPNLASRCMGLALREVRGQ